MNNVRINFFNSITFRLFILLFLLSLILATLYLTVSGRYINNLIESDTRERSDFVLKEATELFSDILKEVEDFFLITKSNHEVYDILEVEYDDIFLERVGVENSFMQFINNSENLQNLHYYDFRGNSLVNIIRRKRVREYNHISASDITLIELFQKVQRVEAGKIVYSGPYTIEGDIYYYAGIGLVDPNMGEVGGILILGFEIEHYIKELDKFTLYGEHALWLITENRKLIKGVENSVISPYPLNNPDSNLFTLKQSATNRDSDFNFFNIYVSVSDRIYKDRIRDLVNKTLIFSLSIVVIISILSVIISIQFTKPLNILTKTAIAIGSGELDREIDISAKSEIGILAKHFSQMTSNLIDINRNLESIVEERTKELEIRNEEVRNFSYIVSHDLKSPLVSINGFANEIGYGISRLKTIINSKESLNREDIFKIEEVITEDFDESLEFITASVERMETLVGLVLQYSRLGRKEVHFSSVDINNLVDSIIKSLSYQISQSNSTIEYHELPVIRGDYTSLEQIFGNLIDNALKYLDKNRPGIITITCSESEEFFEFIIEDNGTGIADGNLEKVFEIFRRGRQIDIEGSGMGLAYVKTLVHKHGGIIRCESELNRGCRFIFTISKKL